MIFIKYISIIFFWFRYICPVSDQATAEFEKLLFGPFESIISQSIQGNYYYY